MPRCTCFYFLLKMLTNVRMRKTLVTIMRYVLTLPEVTCVGASGASVVMAEHALVIIRLSLSIDNIVCNN